VPAPAAVAMEVEGDDEVEEKGVAPSAASSTLSLLSASDCDGPSQYQNTDPNRDSPGAHSASALQFYFSSVSSLHG
jgi:hypothetical protein